MRRVKHAFPTCVPTRRDPVCPASLGEAGSSEHTAWAFAVARAGDPRSQCYKSKHWHNLDDDDEEFDDNNDDNRKMEEDLVEEKAEDQAEIELSH